MMLAPVRLSKELELLFRHVLEISDDSATTDDVIDYLSEEVDLHGIMRICKSADPNLQKKLELEINEIDIDLAHDYGWLKELLGIGEVCI